MAKGKMHIGTSGWSNSNWKGYLYPQDMKPKDFLAYYSQRFNAAEINTTFYHTPKTKIVENWIANAPDGFRFAVKISQYLTHIKRLKEPEEPLERFFTAIEPLQKHIGPVLIQLPPSLKFDYETAAYFFDILKRKYHQYIFVLEAAMHHGLKVKHCRYWSNMR